MENKNSKKNSEQNNRRYPRVFLTKGAQELDRLGGLEVKWPGGFTTGALDISYIGAALVKTSKITQKFQKGDKIEFLFSFVNGPTEVPFQAEVIREDEKALAVFFPELSLKARRALEGFLKEKLIGLNTKLVDSKYYVKAQGFDFWFHGPNQTNVFIWTLPWENTVEIQKATFEINGEVLSFEKNKFYLSESKSFLQTPTEDYSYKVNNPEAKELLKAKATKKVVHDVISLLSQIEDNTLIIKKLIEKMIDTLEIPAE